MFKAICAAIFLLAMVSESQTSPRRAKRLETSNEEGMLLAKNNFFMDSSTTSGSLHFEKTLSKRSVSLLDVKRYANIN